MIKRVLAWILLIGFVLLIINLIFFRYYWQVSLALYIAAVLCFMFSVKKDNT